MQWQIGNSAIDSVKILNDTSIQIWFRNINWQGKLYALLPGPACNLSPVDSINISILRAPEPVNIGNDTALCNQQSLVLHAGNNFATYFYGEMVVQILYLLSIRREPFGYKQLIFVVTVILIQL